jgi:hypothetical protein
VHYGVAAQALTVFTLFTFITPFVRLPIMSLTAAMRADNAFFVSILFPFGFTAYFIWILGYEFQ